MKYTKLELLKKGEELYHTSCHYGTIIDYKVLFGELWLIIDPPYTSELKEIKWNERFGKSGRPAGVPNKKKAVKPVVSKFDPRVKKNVCPECKTNRHIRYSKDGLILCTNHTSWLILNESDILDEA